MKQVETNKKHSKYRKIDGVLIFNKPIGIVSNKILQKVRYIFKAKKAGHTGSLDPLASGVLPICFGQATKFSQFLLDSDKTYQVTAKLGVETDTGDSDGNIINTSDVPNFTLSDIEKVLTKYRGEIEQIPSMYSAIKHNGKPLYKYAREGITIERNLRKINIYSLELVDFCKGSNNSVINNNNDLKFENMHEILNQVGDDKHDVIPEMSVASYPGSNLKFENMDNFSQHCEAAHTQSTLNKANDELTLKVHCSKGTYIRTLVEDIGKDLGCGACVIKLERLSVGPFTIDQAISYDTLLEINNSITDKEVFNQLDQIDKIEQLDQLEQLKQLDQLEQLKQLDQYLLPVNVIISHLQPIKLPRASTHYICCGNPVFVSNAPTEGMVSLFDKETDTFLGVGEVLQDGKIGPRRLLQNISIL